MFGLGLLRWKLVHMSVVSLGQVLVDAFQVVVTALSRDNYSVVVQFQQVCIILTKIAHT